MKGRARRVSENEPALLFAETPEVRDRQERAEVWSAQTTTIGGFEPREIDFGRRFDEGGAQADQSNSGYYGFFKTEEQRDSTRQAECIASLYRECKYGNFSPLCRR